MITWEEARENPELMIKHKEDLKQVKIFGYPWYRVFRKHPHLYREFSDRFNELSGVGIAYALRDDPTLVLDLKNHLHKMSGMGIAYALRDDPTLVLDLKNHLHKMSGWDIAYTLRYAPTLVLDLKNYLHKIGGEDIKWLSWNCPEMSLCMEYRGDLDKVEAAYYITFPRKLDDLNNKEKREILKKTMEFLKEEKT